MLKQYTHVGGCTNGGQFLMSGIFLDQSSYCWGNLLFETKLADVQLASLL